MKTLILSIIISLVLLVQSGCIIAAGAVVGAAAGLVLKEAVDPDIIEIHHYDEKPETNIGQD